MEAKLGVAYTIINRIRHEAYPSNLYSVIFERMSNGNYQYETLNSPNDTIEWQEAKIHQDPEYSDVFQATVDALCRWKNDPTECATNFCSVDPCPATDSNPWWLAVKKRKLGGLYFVCRVSATAQSDRRSRGRDWKWCKILPSGCFPNKQNIVELIGGFRFLETSNAQYTLWIVCYMKYFIE